MNGYEGTTDNIVVWMAGLRTLLFSCDECLPGHVGKPESGKEYV